MPRTIRTNASCKCYATIDQCVVHISWTSSGVLLDEIQARLAQPSCCPCGLKERYHHRASHRLKPYLRVSHLRECCASAAIPIRRSTSYIYLYAGHKTDLQIEASPPTIRFSSQRLFSRSASPRRRLVRSALLSSRRRRRLVGAFHTYTQGGIAGLI